MHYIICFETFEWCRIFQLLCTFQVWESSLKIEITIRKEQCIHFLDSMHPSQKAEKLSGTSSVVRRRSRSQSTQPTNRIHLLNISCKDGTDTTLSREKGHPSQHNVIASRAGTQVQSWPWVSSVWNLYILSVTTWVASAMWEKTGKPRDVCVGRLIGHCITPNVWVSGRFLKVLTRKWR